MEYEIKEFKNKDFGKIRVIDIAGQTWFIGKDIADALGYVKSRNAVLMHVDAEDKATVLMKDTDSCYKSRMIIVNESGLYSLILSSKLPNARLFKHWVTSEVLPTIRKKGVYISDEKLEKLKKDAAMADKLLQALTEETIHNIALESKNAELEYKGEYYDKVLKCDKTLMSVTVIAKDYGMTAADLNKLLRNFKVQFKTGSGTWVLYSKYHDMGYTKTKTFLVPNGDDNRTVTVTYWTERGKELIYRVLKKHGILPLSEYKDKFEAV